MMNGGIAAYKKTFLETAGKKQILLMLYQAAINHCQQSIKAIEENNISAKGESIGKLQDIIIELHNSLDFEIGGDLAHELSALYDYLLFSSTQANIQIKKEPLEGCLAILSTLYEGWVQAVDQLKDKK